MAVGTIEKHRLKHGSKMNTFSRISQTRINKLRSEAKLRSKSTGEPLHRCLEQVAKENGSATWHQILYQSGTAVGILGQDAPPESDIAPGLAFLGYQNSKFAEARSYNQFLEIEGLSEVSLNTPRGYIFIDVTIEGHRFQAGVADELFIQLKSKFGRQEIGHCDLGTASIAFPETSRLNPGEKHWSVCKYENQRRIDLSDLSDAGRRRLAFEFGLPILANELNLRWSIPTHFYASKAYAALVIWTKKHPGEARSYGRGDYLGHWAIAALLDAGLMPSAEQKMTIEAMRNAMSQ